jgi:hypothetical protein
VASGVAAGHSNGHGQATLVAGRPAESLTGAELPDEADGDAGSVGRGSL